MGKAANGTGKTVAKATDKEWNEDRDDEQGENEEAKTLKKLKSW